MKVLAINSVPYGSTCGVMTGIAETAKREGMEIAVATGYSHHPVKFNVDHIKIGGVCDKALHMLLGQLTGRVGDFSTVQTWRFLKKVDRFHPDVIHLHNLHGWFLNLDLLFRYIKKNDVHVVWTLHDCWAFTGHCPHFTMIKCDKWKTGCYKCPQYKNYPQSFIDNSKMMYERKKKWFSGVKNMTIVTPSQWLADQVKQSYLKDYPIKVINNGIDLDVFKPTPSEFKERYHIPKEKKVILGVAFGWGTRKGLDVFIELAKRLDEREYQIVLVGTDENVDKQLPKSIISIHRTQNQRELAEIYTAADLFVNPTREETQGLVNIESNACGTPVITFETGGSPECIDATSGSVVTCDDIAAMEKEIIRMCGQGQYSVEACTQRANTFNMNERFRQYVQLYENEV